MKLSEKIVMLRKQKGFSQEELAECLNVSRQTISRWELDTALPDATNIVQLSKLFEVSSDYLLNDDYKSDQDIPAVKHHKDFLMIFALQIMCFVFHLITCIFLNRAYPLQIASLALNLFFAKQLYEELKNYNILSEVVKKYYIDIYIVLIWLVMYVTRISWSLLWFLFDEIIDLLDDEIIVAAIDIVLYIVIIKFSIKTIKGGNKK